MSESVDLITALVNDLVARLNTLTELCSETVYVCDTNDVLYERKKLQYPAICIVYNNMSATGDDKGRSGFVVFDLWIIADRDRNNRVDGEGILMGTGILTEIRRLFYRAQECQKAPNGRPWEFVSERPVELEKNLVTYLQRWRVRTITFC